jgi:8-oxo-dGTP pyrophosphatase MutT (NUDIX family)
MPRMPVIRAAGGVVWRAAPAGARLAVIHRPRRDDWSLPKGKLDERESWEEAALREVEEETGCVARISSFAGATWYLPRRAPKIVLYWNMELVEEGKLDAGDEVDEVAWLTPADAMARLDYAGERRILARASPPNSPAPTAARGGPVVAAAAAVRADVLRRILALGPRGDPAGLGPALDLLDRAEDAAGRAGADEVRGLVRAAQRLALLSLEEPELSLQARALREEARRLAPWRRRAVRQVLAGDRPAPEAVFLAATIRDEEGEVTVGWWRAAVMAAGAAALAAGVALVQAGSLGAAGAGAAAGLVAGGAAGFIAARGRRTR